MADFCLKCTNLIQLQNMFRVLLAGTNACERRRTMTPFVSVFLCTCCRVAYSRLFMRVLFSCTESRSSLSTVTVACVNWDSLTHWPSTVCGASFLLHVTQKRKHARIKRGNRRGAEVAGEIRSKRQRAYQNVRG